MEQATSNYSNTLRNIEIASKYDFELKITSNSYNDLYYNSDDATNCELKRLLRMRKEIAQAYKDFDTIEDRDNLITMFNRYNDEILKILGLYYE